MTRRVDGPAVALVAERAAGCADLAELASVVSTCVACPLSATRTRVVAGDLVPGARVLLVGEGPGAQEDLEGRPFVGRAGRLLDQLLADVGIGRETVSVVNVVKCRPPDNRTPTRGESQVCAGWLDRQIALAHPQVVVTLGGTALAWAFGPGTRLRDARGTFHDRDGRRLLATYHPSAALRFGPQGEPMRALREDLARLADLLCTS